MSLPAAKERKTTPSATRSATPARRTELVIITGLSGSGKGTALKALEDLGYYSVDNLPIDLIPKFAELAGEVPRVRRAAIVVDIREGSSLDRFPAMYKRIREKIPTRLLFLEADDATLIRRFSETRRPHPLGADQTVAASVRRERERLEPSGGWPIPSSTPASSMCMSCATPFTAPSADLRAIRRS